MNEHLLPGDASPDDRNDNSNPRSGSSFGAGLDERGERDQREPKGARADASSAVAEPKSGDPKDGELKKKARRRRKKAADPKAAEASARASATAEKAAPSKDGGASAGSDPGAPGERRKKKRRSRKKGASATRAGDGGGRAEAGSGADDDDASDDATDDATDDASDGGARPEPSAKKVGRTLRRGARRPAGEGELDAESDADGALDDDDADEIDADDDAGDADDVAADDVADDDVADDDADDDAVATDASPRQRGAAGESGAAEGHGLVRKRRRRGSRGGRRRKAGKGSEAAEVETIPGEEDDLPPSSARRKGESDRGRRDGGRDSRGDGGREAGRDSRGDAGGRGSAADARDGQRSGKKKRRRRRRKGGAGAGSRREDDDELSDDAGEDDAELEAAAEEGGGSGRRTRSRRKRADADGEKDDEASAAEQEALRTHLILVNAVEPEEKRVVVVEKEHILDLLMTAESQKTLVNDVYRGKVVNLEPAIGAAFIDFGQGRNGFLHTSDVLPIYGEDDFRIEHLLTARVDEEEWAEDERVDPRDLKDEDEDGGASKAKSKEGRGKGRGDRGERRKGRDRRPINELLRVGDPVVVQVTKDAIGDKGPTLTTYISIPGRYLVLMPSMSRTGVSRKIPDEKERRRLKRILASMNVPDDMGVIVRTAGIGKKKEDLTRDLEYLLGVWDGFGKKLRASRAPAPLYVESDVATRTLRDLFSAYTKKVVVDDYSVHEQMVEFAAKLMPEHAHRIELYDGERPIFHQYGIEPDFERIFSRRVDLPSGGSIVFDQAEALVAIDVNSGRTRTDSYDFEQIALKTNLEAVPEIARQIKLRDLGGILVCDFIDMVKPSSNRQVERALRDALEGDRARSKLGRISQFGLLELTRQRLGPGTHKKVFQTCPRCRGTGQVRSMESRAQAILRRLGSALAQKGFTTVEVRAHPEVVKYLKSDLYDYVRAMEHRTEREIRFADAPEQAEDSVLRYLRADGREVRPGGRRKR